MRGGVLCLSRVLPWALVPTCGIESRTFAYCHHGTLRVDTFDMDQPHNVGLEVMRESPKVENRIALLKSSRLSIGSCSPNRVKAIDDAAWNRS
jgi:hypothetical protein